MSGQWHTYANTYANTYDVHIDREGEIVVTWHGTSKVVPGDDRDLIQWAFDQGREFERVQPTRWKASPANWCEATMAERDLTMREAAVKIHEVFLSLMDAGFLDPLRLPAKEPAGGSNPPTTPTKPKSWPLSAGVPTSCARWIRSSLSNKAGWRDG